MDNHCSKKIRSGVGQLTIVEHALCPLDARISALPNQVHEATFRYSDKHRSRRTGNARVFAPLGLSPKDELFLWGLLAITLSDPHTDGELHATRHYCLRKLGLIDAKARRGGRQYRDFSSAIERLSSVRYQCDGFYDPIRAEHRRVSFGFFSYSLPLSDESSRAWRIVWDPVFFEFAKATGGSLRFNLDLYCRLDAATRRCYLYLAKLFYRKTETPRLDVRDFAEQILGIAATVELRDKKAKLQRCIDTLTDCGVIRNGQITRLGKGRFMMVLHRGPEFDRPVPALTFESPLVEPLISVGFDAAGANRIIRRYDDRLTREWVDITLAARERFGPKFFKSSPPAFLTDNLKKASVGERTAPDWWAEVRKAELRACAERAKACKTTPEGGQLADRAIETLENVHSEIFSHFVAGGQAEEVARANAERFKAARRRKQKSKPK